MRLGAHDQRKRFAVAKLVVAPTLKPSEDWVKALVWIAFKLPEDRDVTGVADFFAQVGCVKNVLWLEVGVGLGALEVAQVEAQAKVF